ncbi:DUF6541 family protein [Agromyces atrinae]|uniref:Glycosyltransferase RgtA/B/C/D-like domain-containing protein n=1 Tax=Agromyces atrinae TaxID=592376 RepID=A0A4Q2M620_9MICO|nr:DUF6541 family protein [Agromyces atrinae]NYD66705.1 hypothetical protein [Agromyces atrinae]RXZ87368.1 hypothetical protein ESP50_05460 [Agromyces atrinae]
MGASWFGMIPVVLVAIIVIAGPGLLLLRLLAARGFLLVAAAPAVSVAFYGGFAVVLGALGIGWSLATIGAALLASALVCFGIGRLVVRRAAPAAAVAEPGGGVRTVLPAWALASALVATSVVIGLGSPDALSQTFDNAFHLNGIRFILDTGDASSFSLTGVIGASGIYPAAWHDVVSVVVLATGASIPVATNATTIVLAAIVWPGAALLLARAVAGRGRAATWSGAVLAAALPSFPLLPLTFGVLYPYFLAALLLPVALAVGLSLLGRGDPYGAPAITRILLLVAAFAAMALAQPALAFVAAAFLLVPLLGRGFDLARDGSIGRRVLLAVGAVVLVVGFAAAWVVIGRFGSSAPWGPRVGPRRGLVELLLQTREDLPPAIIVAVLVVVGLVVCFRRPRRIWLAVVWLFAAGLFFVAEAISSPLARDILLGLFYKDPPRLAVVFAIASLPVAVVGAVALWSGAIRLLDRARPAADAGRDRVRLVAGALALVLIAAASILPVRAATLDLRTAFALTDDAPIISIDERALLERVRDSTNGEGVVVGNPWTGTSLLYALDGQRVLNPHFNVVRGTAAQTVNSGLVDLADDPIVCDAVRDVDARWVLDFGERVRDVSGILWLNPTAGFEGLSGFADAEGFTEVDREGDAALYAITGCD